MNAVPAPANRHESAQRVRGQFSAVVPAGVTWRAARGSEMLKDLDGVIGRDVACDLHRQSFAGELVDDVKQLDLPAGEGPVELEVDRPTAPAWANEWPRNTTRTARTMWADALRDGVCQHNPLRTCGWRRRRDGRI
jgi:hypothetical protein